jgi:hypothetical protein
LLAWHVRLGVEVVREARPRVGVDELHCDDVVGPGVFGRRGYATFAVEWVVRGAAREGVNER